YIDYIELNRFETFALNVYHFTGQYAGKPFILSPYQCFFITNVLGFKRVSDNQRRFTTAFLMVGRKNGKTAFNCLLSLYNLIFSGHDPQILVCAPSLEQSRINLYQTQQYLKSIDPDKKYLIPQYSKIKNLYAGGKLQIRAADYRRLDGENNSMCLLDELHQMKECQQVIEVLRSGQGSRLSPLLIMITTAGLDLLNYTYTGLYLKYKEMLNGEIPIPEHTFIQIYELDKEDYENDAFLTDYNLIEKANPNLGISVSKEFIISEIESIKSDYSKRTGVLTKNLNVWVDYRSINQEDEEIYIPIDTVREKMIDIDLDELKGHYCYMAVDLSSTSDLNVLSVMIPNVNGYHYYKNYFYLPEQNNNIKELKSQFAVWAKNGMIKLTEGNCLDSLAIVKDIQEIAEKLNVVELALDVYNSSSFQLQMGEHCPNIPIVPFKQSFLNFNLATKEFKIMLMKDYLRLDKNSVTLWNFSNAVIQETQQGNQKVMKRNRNKSNKIDSVISMQMATHLYLTGGYVYTA
ncbi:terminase large subunit, partial [Parabacteroides sp. OttesenSCG-928-J18]|nr:terminase large subunit [Parabacteroides sp. OttesenSCG-928-J18]